VHSKISAQLVGAWAPWNRKCRPIHRTPLVHAKKAEREDDGWPHYWRRAASFLLVALDTEYLGMKCCEPDISDTTLPGHPCTSAVPQQRQRQTCSCSRALLKPANTAGVARQRTCHSAEAARHLRSSLVVGEGSCRFKVLT
jgi:hypothetical protein